MFRVAAFACLVIAVSADAMCAPSPVAAAFGNTIVSTYPDARTAELWLTEDGRYTARGRRGDPSSGTWKLKSGKLCLKQAHPLHVPFSFCTPLPSTGMGASWRAKAVTGEPIVVAVVRGHFVGKAREA